MPATGPDIGVQMSDRITNLTARAEVVRATPRCFQLGDNKVVPSDRILVAFENPGGYLRIGRQQIRPVHRPGISENEYLFQVPQAQDPLRVSSEIAELPGVSYAEPDFITVGRHVPKYMRPQGPAPAAPPAPAAVLHSLLPQQYAMSITGAVAAWQLMAGKS